MAELLTDEERERFEEYISDWATSGEDWDAWVALFAKRLLVERDTLSEKLTAFEGMLDTIHVSVAELKIQRELAQKQAIKVRCCFAGVGQACPIHEK